MQMFAQNNNSPRGKIDMDRRDAVAFLQRASNGGDAMAARHAVDGKFEALGRRFRFVGMPRNDLLRPLLLQNVAAYE